jgi:CheY-like chemotaxis protein
MDVLVVEDEDDIRELLVLLLSMEGLEVESARDGLEALAAVRHGARPAVILLDLMMPRMSGGDFLRARRRDPELARVPTVIVSGDPEAARTGARLGADGLVMKPLDLDELLHEVHRFVPPPGDQPELRSS